MTKLLTIIVDGFLSLFALVFPMLARARANAAESANPIGRWLGRIVLVGPVLWLLWRLNQSETIGLKYWVTGRLGEYWLPLFAACLYAMIWLGWWLHRELLREIEPIGSEFPDIDSAWNQAREALVKAKISLLDTPLFLIFGWNSGSDEALFRASGMRLPVDQVPKGLGDPIRVSANREGIWITCQGASSLAQQNSALRGGSVRSSLGDETLSGLLEDSGGGGDHGTFGAGGGAGTLRIDDIMKGSLGELIRREKGKAPGREISDPELHKARLRHLCKLITRDREGWCPVNGVLVLLPIAATDPKANLPEIAASCRADLAAALETFRIRCPTVFAVCDLETLPGFSEMVERLPAEQARKRVGQRFPLVPDIGHGDVPAKIQSSVLFTIETVFPTLVYSLFSVDTPGGEELSDVLGANAKLFRFLTALRDRQARLAQLVMESAPSMAAEPQFFSGCYFAGNGDTKAGSAFAPGVFARLIQDQNRVTWTTDYLEEDASFQRLSVHLRTFLIAAIAISSALAVYMVVAFLRR